MISYNTKTTPGHSGSPLIAGADQNIVVGVHKANAKNKVTGQEVRKAIKLTFEIILMLEIWREELDADRFKLIDL